MQIHRFSESVLVKKSIAVTLANSTQTGTAIDCQGFRRAALIFTTYTGAATTSNFTVEESDDNSTWVAVSALTLAAAILASQTPAPYLADIDLAYRKRYLRINSVGTGTAGAAVGNLCLFQAENAAVTQDNTSLHV